MKTRYKFMIATLVTMIVMVSAFDLINYLGGGY